MPNHNEEGEEEAQMEEIPERYGVKTLLEFWFRMGYCS